MLKATKMNAEPLKVAINETNPIDIEAHQICGKWYLH